MGKSSCPQYLVASIARDVHIDIVVVWMDERAFLLPTPLGCPRLDVSFDVAGVGTVVPEFGRVAQCLEPRNEGWTVIVGHSLRVRVTLVVHHQLGTARELDE